MHARSLLVLVAAAATIAAETAVRCAAGPPRLVPPTQVADGIADCCDGSDEPPGTVDVPERGCDIEMTALRKAALSLKEAHMAGAARAAKSQSRQSTAKRREKRDELMHVAQQEGQRAQPAFAAYHAAYERLQKIAQQRPQGRTAAARHQAAYHAAVEEFQQRQGAAAAAAEAANNAALRANAWYGPQDAWMPLLGAPCISTGPIGEKTSKGGSSTSVPKTYVYSLCWGSQVFQREWRPKDWIKADAIAQGREPQPPLAAAEAMVAVKADGSVSSGSGSGDDDDVVASADAFGQPTLLGTWVGYLALFDPPPPLATEQQKGGKAGSKARKGPSGDAAGAASSGSASEWDRHFAAGMTFFTGVADARVAAAKVEPHDGQQWASGAAASGAQASPTLALADVVQVFNTSVGGPCRSESVETSRRVYVHHVCPGVMPRDASAVARALYASAFNATSTSNSRSEAGSDSGSGSSEWMRALPSWARVHPRLAAGSWNGGSPVPVPDFPPPPRDLGELDAPTTAATPLARIVDVVEDGLCTYRLTVASPFACAKRAGAGVDGLLAAFPAAEAGV